jgi:Zn-dependent protease
MPPASAAPAPQPAWKKWGTTVAMGLALVAKFFAQIKFFILPALKFLPVLLKTGGSMFIMIWVYSTMMGWPFALGFVVLIFVHEIGHVLAAKWVNLPVTAPLFIPFLGAHILLKKMPPNAKIEAIVGIGGPLLGTVGCMVCHVIFTRTDDPFWLMLADSGYMLNLFNMIPLTPLDGGRICSALSPWLWIPGLLLLIGLMIQSNSINFVGVLILLAALPKVWGLFRAKSAEEQRYYNVAMKDRVAVALGYFGLAGLLLFQKEESMGLLRQLGFWRD